MNQPPRKKDQSTDPLKLTVLHKPLEDLVHARPVVLVDLQEVGQAHAAELLPRQRVVGLSPEEGAVEVLGVREGEDPVEDLARLPVLRVLVGPAGEGLRVAVGPVQVCAGGEREREGGYRGSLLARYKSVRGERGREGGYRGFSAK